MTKISTVSPDGAASGSTPNECSATKINAAKLNVQHELGRKKEEAPLASDIPRRARKLRVTATIVALLAVLGIGWGAGLKTHELGNLGQVPTWLLIPEGSRPGFRDDGAHHSEMISPTVPK